MSISDISKRSAPTVDESKRRSPVTRRNVLSRGAQVVGGFAIAGGISSGSVRATHREERFTTIDEQDAAGYSITNPCTGERLEYIKGTAQLVTHFQVQPNHDFIAHASFAFKNVSAIGLDDGEVFQIYFNQNATLIGNLDEDFPLRYTWRGDLGIVSRGTDKNYKAFILLVTVITPDGDFTVESLSTGDECIG